MLCGGSPARQTASGQGPAEVHNRGVGRKKKRHKRAEDPLEVYKRIRKPMPPPEKVIEDKRDKLEEEQARREIEEER